MKKSIIIILLIIGCFQFGKAQENHVVNMDWYQKGEIIIITYDLKKTHVENYYVSVTAKLNNRPVTVSTPKGDVGKVRRGNNKKITWEVLRDAHTLIGDLEIEVNAEVFSNIKPIVIIDGEEEEEEEGGNKNNNLPRDAGVGAGITTGLFSTLQGIKQEKKAKEQYNTYKENPNPNDEVYELSSREELYKTSNKQHKQATALKISGATLVVGGVVLWILRKTGKSPVKTSYEALEKLLETDFFDKYENTKTRVEKKVQRIKSYEHRYNDEDFESLQDSYYEVQQEYNQILKNIKNDLLDKRQIRYIIQNSEAYETQISKQLKYAKKSAEEFERKYYELAPDEVSGRKDLLPIEDLINSLIDAIGMFQEIKAEAKRYNEELLEKHLMKNHRFKSWEDIGN